MKLNWKQISYRRLKLIFTIILNDCYLFLIRSIILYKYNIILSTTTKLDSKMLLISKTGIEKNMNCKYQ